MLQSIGRLSAHQQRILLVLGCAVLFCLWLTRVPLTEIDEARYAEATRTMVATGGYRSYIIPTFNGEPRYQKPIFYYWMQALPVRLFGVNEVAARLPSGIAGILLVLLAHGLLLRWLHVGTGDDPVHRRGRGIAFLGGVALASMPMTGIWARAATTDMTLTLCISASLVALLEADLCRQGDAVPDAARHRRRAYLLAALFAGLASLTKGPVGIIIPLLTWVAYHAAGRTLKQEVRRLPWLGGVSAFLLVAAPWYITTVFVDGPAFLRHFLMTENVARFTTTMEGHGTGNRLLGLLTYLPVALVLLFPYSGVLLRDLMLPLAGNGRLRDDEATRRIRRLLWLWIAVTIGVFSLSSTQLPSYIHSVVLPAALLAALHLYGRVGVRAGKTRRRFAADGAELAAYLLVGVVWVGGLVWALLQGKAGGPLGSMPMPKATAIAVATLLGLAGGGFLGGILLSRRRDDPHVLAAGLLTAWPLFMAVVLLGAAPLVVRSSYGLSMATGQYVRTVARNEPVLAYTRQTSESLVYYARHRVAFYVHDDPASFVTALYRTLDEHGSLVLVTDDEGLTQARALTAVTPLKRFGPVQVVRVSRLSLLGSPHIAH